MNLKSRRGLSTVVTSALLLTAVAILGASMVSWSNSNLKSFETKLVNTTAGVTNQANENLVFENIVFCYGVNEKCPLSSAPPLTWNYGVNITLTNTGTVSVNVAQIQLNGTSWGANLAPAAYTPTLPTTILPKQTITFEQKWAWNHKSLQTISVVTSRGSIFTIQAVPP
ncbi:MAG: hypothetical protein ACREBI_04475 [Nitrosotalea sp.]